MFIKKNDKNIKKKIITISFNEYSESKFISVEYNIEIFLIYVLDKI